MEQSERVRGLRATFAGPSPDLPLAGRPLPAEAGRGESGESRARGKKKERSMTRFQIIAIRLLLLAVVLAAWEVLPRNGVVNPMLLPPLTDVLAMLVQLLGRPQVHEAILVTAAEVIV